MSANPTPLPTVMRAVRLTKFGTPAEALVDAEVPVPAPTDTESLVEVHAAGINPSDVAMVAGRFGSELPAIPGGDFAGVVVEGQRTGEEVWGRGVGFGVTRPGAHAQYVAVPTGWLSPKPAALSMREAAGVPLPYCTAWSALVKTGGLTAGQTLLVIGGLGAVGQAAADIAAWKGAKVIVADRHQPSSSIAYVSTEQDDFEERVLQMTDSKGADVVLDMVGGPRLGQAMKTMRARGHYLVMASPGGPQTTLDIPAFYRLGLRMSGVNMVFATGIELRHILDELAPLFEARSLHPPATRAWRLADAGNAYQVVSDGARGVKQILLPHDDKRA